MHIQNILSGVPLSPSYNNNIQVSIVEGKISLFRITSRAVVTPDITTQYDTGKNGTGKLGILTQHNVRLSGRTKPVRVPTWSDRTRYCRTFQLTLQLNTARLSLSLLIATFWRNYNPMLLVK